MAFNVQSWGRISGSSNNKVTTLQSGAFIGAPGMYTYISATDAVATIAAADYFSPVVVEINVGDLIFAVGSDTSIQLTVAGVNITTKSVVTVQAVGVGDVDGPASATADAIALFSGTTGKVIKNSAVTSTATGELAAGVATEALPTYSFTGRTSTGMWSSAAGVLDFSASGLRGFQIDTSPASAVNYISVVSAVTGTIGLPLIKAKGTDTNIDVGALPKGTGGFSVRGATNAGSIKLWNQANTFFTQFKSAAVASSMTYTTPLAFPVSSGYVLSSDTSGVMTWISNGAPTWVDQTTTPATLAANTSYSANNAGLVTFNMPATAAFGDTFEVAGNGAGGWLIQMNTGQTAHLGSSATSVAGSFASTNQYDCIRLVCVVANTTFVVTPVVGNITVA